jgi:hypothetical protein
MRFLGLRIMNPYSKEKYNRTLGKAGKCSWWLCLLAGICMVIIRMQEISLPERIIKVVMVGIFLPLFLIVLSILLSCLQWILYLIGKAVSRPYESTLVAQYIEKFVSPFLPRYRGESEGEGDVRLLGFIRIHPFASVYYGVAITMIVVIIMVVWGILANSPRVVQWIQQFITPLV